MGLLGKSLSFNKNLLDGHDAKKALKAFVPKSPKQLLADTKTDDKPDTPSYTGYLIIGGSLLVAFLLIGKSKSNGR